MSNPTYDIDQAWHAETADAATEHLKSRPDEGLSTAEARKRLEAFGPNKLPEPESRHPLMRFLAQFHNILIYLLLVAAVVAGFLGEFVEAAVILAVVIINVLISFIQEGRAEKALEGIRNMLSLDAAVLRDGQRKRIDAEDLVPGDIVRIRSGDKVPADLRLLSVKSLRVEESALTGESEEVEKQTDSVDAGAVLGDRTNMAFSGTTVTYGEATGMVVKTGTHTELGRINTMISDVGDKTTPLLLKIDRFGKGLSVVILLVAASFFAYGLLIQEYALEEMFMAAISIIVAFIPEGLPAILTITLAIGVQRMARRHAIIRRLPSVETLGSVSVICSDKTGTLTRNEMTAKSIVTTAGAFSVEGSGYRPDGAIQQDNQAVSLESQPVLNRLLQAARLCNDAVIKQDAESQWTLDGTPTEGALMTLAHKAGLADWAPDRVDAVPFESEHKYKATLHSVEDQRFTFLVGAPERVLDRCEVVMESEGTAKLDRADWEEKMEAIASRGERVIACAYREEDTTTSTIDHEDLREGFVFLGLIGIIDPPRDEVLDAIAECREAGIRVIMITGDHAVTAQAVARQLGIPADEEPITGAALADMSDAELEEAIQHHSVFARTNPEHKLRLVKALQAQHKLCAMTGDGVNDAPALKRADIGIAMGIKGTEVTKEAAEMVLADDNFTSIVHAVEEGRTVYDNIKKTILFLLPANGAEAGVIMAAVLMGITLPISPVQILWVNMVSAVTLALALTVEPMEQQVMRRPPRRKSESLIGTSFVWRILFVSLISGGLTFALFSWHFDPDAGDAGRAQARTIAVNMLVIAHAFYLFTCRRLYESSFNRTIFNNRLAFVMVGLLLIIQLMFTYAPFMNYLFGTAPIPGSVWPVLLAGGMLVMLLVELEKWITRKRQPSTS